MIGIPDAVHLLKGAMEVDEPLFVIYRARGKRGREV